MTAISDNEKFINLILVAKEDPQIKERLLNILMSDDLTRADLLGQWISHGENKGAPKDFLEALQFLQNPIVAYQVINAISENVK